MPTTMIADCMQILQANEMVAGITRTSPLSSSDSQCTYLQTFLSVAIFAYFGVLARVLLTCDGQ